MSIRLRMILLQGVQLLSEFLFSITKMTLMRARSTRILRRSKLGTIFSCLRTLWSIQTSKVLPGSPVLGLLKLKNNSNNNPLKKHLKNILTPVSKKNLNSCLAEWRAKTPSSTCQKATSLNFRASKQGLMQLILRKTLSTQTCLICRS